jgi:protocatechuate 3,4-dioxygenase beta subunit
MPRPIARSLLVVAVAASAAAQGPQTSDRLGKVTGREPIVGLPCEGCEAVFDGIPTTLDAAARIAPAAEPGVPMRLEGTVRDATGVPAPGIVVYGYHTDASGVYPKGARATTEAARRHGRLRGWARTGVDGRYRFDTIRPAAYPSRGAPEHVHLHVIEPGRATYYIDDVEFEDDPLLTPARRRRPGRGGPGIARPRRENGTWVVTRDIALGRGVTGYPK